MCRLIYEEKRLYIHEVGGKKVDVSHRLTTKMTTTNCHYVGSRRQVDNNEHSHRIVAYQTVRLRCSGSSLVSCRSQRRNNVRVYAGYDTPISPILSRPRNRRGGLDIVCVCLL